MSSELKSKTMLELFSDALFIIKKNWFKLILFYFIPFIILNTIGGIASVGLDTFKENKIAEKPFTFYFSTKQKIEIDSKKDSAKVDKKINGWSYIEKLPQKELLKIKISTDKKWTEYRINSSKFKRAWLVKNRVVYKAPASFNLRLPALPSETVRFIAQIGSVIVNLVFLLFVLAVALFTYFNKPPISISEIIRFMKSNILNFLATGMFEGKGIVKSLKRSFELSKENILKIISPLFITVVIGLILFFIANTIAASILNIAAEELAINSARIIGKTILIWPQALLLISTIFLILFSPIVVILVTYFYNLYIDLRIRKENLAGNLKEDFFKVEKVEEK